MWCDSRALCNTKASGIIAPEGNSLCLGTRTFFSSLSLLAPLQISVISGTSYNGKHRVLIQKFSKTFNYSKNYGEISITLSFPF